jgi:ribose/xylose/arabinose/galactoside ABC-type transport system permease subunit/ABC-type branched-subunit amino acid transport system ATPase component
MVGRELGEMYEKAAATPGEVMLEVRGLSSGSVFRDVSLSVRAGEIVGLAGLVGAGRTEVAEAIFGVRAIESGSVEIGGRAVRITSPAQAIAGGLAYVPEDRARNGLLLPMSVRQNTVAAALGKVSALGWLRGWRETEVAVRWRDRLQTRLRDIHQPARELSGGNQQKVVLGKWLETDPRVLLLDEPTRGVDVGAKAEIHHQIAGLARSGKAVLMISSDLPEVLAMSDRIVVMREGRVMGELEAGSATQESVMRLAAGEGESRHVHSAPAGLGVVARLLRARELGVGGFLVVMMVLGAMYEPRLLSAESLRGIMLYIPLIVVAAMGQMMVMVSRNIDLSIGSILAMAAIVVGNLYISHPGMPIVAALAVAAAVGGAAGVINGVLVAWLRVSAIIATLGTMTAIRGLVFVYSGGRQVNNNDLPPGLIALSQTSPVGVPWIVIFAAAVAISAWVSLRQTRTGREIFAIGSNPHAAELRGIPVTRVLMLIYVITGVLAGVAGLMSASRFGYVNPSSTGAQFELVVISAVVIGGVNVFGGAGTVAGVVLGCVLLGLINVALPVLRISPFWQLALYGLAILVAAGTDASLRRLGQKGRKA